MCVTQSIDLIKNNQEYKNDQHLHFKFPKSSICDNNITSDTNDNNIFQTFCPYDNTFSNRYFAIYGSEVYIYKCSFISMLNEGYGGAIFIDYSGQASFPNVKDDSNTFKIEIINCRFLNYELTSSNSFGRALYLDCVDGKVQDCTFTDNTASFAGNTVAFSYENQSNFEMFLSFRINKKYLQYIMSATVFLSTFCALSITFSNKRYKKKLLTFFIYLGNVSLPINMFQ